MTKKNIVGVGVLIKPKDGKFIFQKRDSKAQVNPCRIAPFGGGLKNGEDFLSALVREMKEELSIDIESSVIREIGDFESHVYKEKLIKMFIVENINSDDIELREGEFVVATSLEEAMVNPDVTDFTKGVIKYLNAKD